MSLLSPTPGPFTPAQVLRQCTQDIAKLVAQSTRDPTLEQKLHPINGRPVEVYLVQPGVIGAMSSSNAAGCVFSDSNRYLVFCDHGGAPGMPPPFTLSQRRRFVVLEEYAHALHGDVYTDNPAGMLARTPLAWQVAESFARGYAAERFAVELSATHQTALAQFVLGQQAVNGWVFPSDPSYLKRYPLLVNERASW